MPEPEKKGFSFRIIKKFRESSDRIAFLERLYAKDQLRSLKKTIELIEQFWDADPEKSEPARKKLEEQIKREEKVKIVIEI